MLLSATFLLFSGLVQAVMSPPLNWIFLHPVSWVPAMWVFARLSGRRALAAGWLVGTSANLAIFYWLPATMVRFGGIPRVPAGFLWLLFSAAVGFYAAVFAWGLPRIRRVAGVRWPIAAAAWFCALEFLNPQLFAYLQGVGWYQVPCFFLLSALTGVSGVSFVVILCNAVVLQGLEVGGRRDALARRGWMQNVAVLVALVLVAVGYSTARMRSIAEAERTAPTLRIALVQPNHTIERRAALASAGPETFARDVVSLSRRAAARAAAQGPIDVFVWPEGTLRTDPAQPENRLVGELVRETGAEVWTGAIHHARNAGGEPVSHNAAFRVRGDGSIDRRYDKNVLVPFGEYMPLRGVVPGLDRIEIVGDFEAGDTVPVYDSAHARFVFLICYEAIWPRFVRRVLADGVDLLVNLTVDAWYGNTSEQSQHLMLAAVQSALNGVPLVRVTTTGISAFVDARGVIEAHTGVFSREVLVRDVRPVRVPSTYSRAGDWFAWLCVAASAGMMLASGSIRRPLR